MKIISVELWGYRRFKFNGTRYFKLTATGAIQIILGTNGSGKSALLDAISPFPQPSNEYSNGGKRILVIEHRNNHYRLVSDFTGNPKHRFEKNGEDNNLNPGGTGTVQKELVESELGITVQIYELLTGKWSFTDMSPSQRREWITRISGIDLDLIQSIYQSVKVELRDLQGAIKHNELRLGRESEKVTDTVGIEKLAENTEELQRRVSFWLEQKNNNIPNYHTVKERYTSLSDKIERNSVVMMSLTNKIKNTPYTSLNSIDKIVEREQELKTSESTERALLNVTEVTLSENNQTLKQLRDEKAVDLVGLEGKLSVLLDHQKVAFKHENTFDVNGDLVALIRENEATRLPIHDVVSGMSGNMLSDLPEQKHWSDVLQAHDETEVIFRRCDDRLLHQHRKLREINDSTSTECPKCKYRWIPGIGERDLELVKSNIQTLNEQRSTMQKELTVLATKVEAINIRRSEIEQLRMLTRSYPRLRELWLHIAGQRFIHTEPALILASYEKWCRECETTLQAQNIEEEIAHVTSTIDRIKTLGKGVDVQYFVIQELTLTDKIVEYQTRILGTQAEIKNIQKYKKDFIDLKSTLASFLYDVETLIELGDSCKEAFFQQHVNSELRIDQLELSHTARRQTELKTVTDIIEDLKITIASLKENAEVHKLLEKALSPTEGIIADVMGGFIKGFIKQLNVLIGMVWEYDLKLITCGTEKGNLDYKFPLQVAESDFLVPDIGKASTGQKEIIDYAFILAAITYHDLQDYPLFLDELGAPFDESHRNKLIHFNKNLVDSGQCSQMWVISHFIAEQGILPNAETCVLSSTNIAVPEIYNEHVILKN